MCAVSMVMDHTTDEWTRQIQRHWTQPQPPLVIQQVPLISQDEVDEFRRLLQRAREYDRRMGEPDCELAEKKAALKTLAEQLGVDIAFVDEQVAT